jgi:CHRD domain
MKKILLISTFIGGFVGALAQGTLQFTVDLNGSNEVPPNDSPYTASGNLTLDGNTLDYSIGRLGWDFLPTSAGIYGPAAPGQTNSLIFDLGNYSLSPNPPELGYGGGFTLTPGEISGLESGLWYVNWTSSTYPDGEIRGQILSVPEPGAAALCIVAMLLMSLRTRYRL